MAAVLIINLKKALTMGAVQLHQSHRKLRVMGAELCVKKDAIVIAAASLRESLTENFDRPLNKALNNHQLAFRPAVR